MPGTRNRYTALSAVLAILAFGAGVAKADYETVKHAHFSPSGRVCVYKTVCILTNLPIGGAEKIGREVTIHWSSGPRFQTWKSRRVYSDGAEKREPGRYVDIEYAFSRDDKLIAVAGSHGVEVVDVESGAARTVSEGYCFGPPVWRGRREIVYGTWTVAAIAVPRRIEFWRVRVDDPDAKPKRVGSADVSLVSEGGKQHAFDPSGRFVIAAPSATEPWILIDMDTGKRTPFGARAEHFPTISWCRDGSAAICISRSEYHSRVQGFHVETGSGRVRDISERLASLKKAMDAKGLRPGISHQLDPLWSWDGRHLVFTNLGWIVELENWGVVDVRERLAKADVDGTLDEIWQSPVVGWYLVRVEEGEDVAPKMMAADVGFSTFRPVKELVGGSYRNSGGYDYVSSDGKHAFIPAGAKVRIVKLEEPLRPIRKPATKP